MSNESSKAMRRRYVEAHTGVFPWWDILSGEGIDVGCGPDLLPVPRCRAFDMQDGDANYLDRYFNVDSFDYLHASQVLEHMHDPLAALSTWLMVVRPGGHLIITVPDWCLYEGMVWPSRSNQDHKSTWSLWLRDSPAPTHVFIPHLLLWLADRQVKTLRHQLVDTRYNYKISPTLNDQTLREEDGVEAFIELVLKKV